MCRRQRRIVEMGIIEDVLNALDRIPKWARLQQVPNEVDELKQKVAALEEKLSGKWPPDVCKFCGERAVRMVSTIGPDQKGNMQETWQCEKCDQAETRLLKPR